MFVEKENQSIDEIMEKIIQLSQESIDYLETDDKNSYVTQLNSTFHSINLYRQNPTQNKETAITECTGLAYRVSTELYNEGKWEASEKLAFASYQLASAADWRERSLGALKQAVLAGVSLPKWDDLDRLRSRVRQRIRKLLGVQGNLDRLPNGIDLNRLTDDVVWKTWEKLWTLQNDEDLRRNLIRKNLRFGWNYSFTSLNNPLKQQFRNTARSYLSGDIASRIAIGEIEAEWSDLFSTTESSLISEWNTNTDPIEIRSVIQEIAKRRTALLSNSLQKWLEWWRPLKTIRETDRDSQEHFRVAQQSIFDDSSLQTSVDKFRIAFELAPDDLGVKEWYAYSLILLEAEKDVDAEYSLPERLLQQIIASKRQDFATIVNLAAIYVRSKKFEQAIDLLCPMELYERNIHRRTYVAAVLGLLISTENFFDIPERVAMLDSVEWMPVGLCYALEGDRDVIYEKLLSRFIMEASVASGKKGSDLSDINDPLVSIAQLDRDFAYFQEEGMIEEGIHHFKERANKYPWFWANWHHLGNMAEIAGDLQLAKDAFFQKARTTGLSKAPKKSKQDNWINYLDFCFKHSLIDGIEKGVEQARIEGVPNQKLNKYLRLLHNHKQEISAGENQIYLNKLSIGECECEEYIESSADRGLIAFELPQPVAQQVEWNLQPIPAWTGLWKLIASNHQDPLRKEIAVEWQSDDESIPAGLHLVSTDSRYDFTMKLYRTDDRKQPYRLTEQPSLLELFPEIQAKVRRHISAGIPGDVYGFEAPAGFGAEVVLSNIGNEAESLQFQFLELSAPIGNLDITCLHNWFHNIAMQLGVKIDEHSSTDLEEAITNQIVQAFKQKQSKHKTVLLVSKFAEKWDYDNSEQSKLIVSFLDGCLKLTECHSLVWFFATEDIFEIRRKIQHPFWKSLQILHIPTLTIDQYNQFLEKWVLDAIPISERAKEVLYELSGGVYEIILEVLNRTIEEVNQTKQVRILASNILQIASLFSTTTSIFSKWTHLLLPSHRLTQVILDRIAQGVQEDENSPDIIYLKDIGLLVNRDQSLHIVTPLYIPPEKVQPYKSSLRNVQLKSPAALIIDHENLYENLREKVAISGKQWNLKNAEFITKIADEFLKWVHVEHNIVTHPLTLANWDREPFINHIRPFQSVGFYTYIPSTIKDNNDELNILLETGKVLNEHPEIVTFIIFTGKQEYTMLVNWLVQQGKRVKIITLKSGSSMPLQSMEGVYYYFIEDILQL